jgi:hypothetical protein
LTKVLGFPKLGKPKMNRSMSDVPIPTGFQVVLAAYEKIKWQSSQPAVIFGPRQVQSSQRYLGRTRHLPIWYGPVKSSSNGLARVYHSVSETVENEIQTASESWMLLKLIST